MKRLAEDIHSENQDKNSLPNKKGGINKWFKRIGVAGFLFFLIKGLLWLMFGAAIIRYLGCEKTNSEQNTEQVTPSAH